MPLYIYEHPRTGEIVEIYQGMNETHTYEADGVVYNRVFTKPNAAIDTHITDPYSAKEFAKATSKAGTMGDMFDRSAELSAKRAEKDGIDPIKQKYYDQYKKDTGKEHYLESREKGQRELKDKGISIEFKD